MESGLNAPRFIPPEDDPSQCAEKHNATGDLWLKMASCTPSKPLPTGERGLLAASTQGGFENEIEDQPGLLDAEGLAHQGG